jgi:hypothetical protein
MYFYHASAVGLAGEISRPIRETIPSQAATSLAVTGGVAYANVENFELENVLSFRRATVQVAGSIDSEHRAHTTMALATLEGLNVLDVLTADKIVARLSATDPSSATAQPSGVTEPQIIAVGSYFENLRIAGQPFQVVLNNEVSEQYSTFESFSRAMNRSGGKLDKWLVGSGLHNIKPGDHPSLVRLERTWRKQVVQRESGRFYWTTLVDHVKSEAGPGIRNYGSIIAVPGFGLIHLAELLIQPGQRRLNMLRLELGSPVSGSIVVGCASCNGLAGDATTDD